MADKAEGPETQLALRDPDALYQKSKLVARVKGTEVDLEAKEVRIEEVYASDNLLIPEEFEYQEFRLVIQHIAFATRLDRGAPEKGRVLRGVIADILGYREQ